MEILLRSDEATATEPWLSPDLVWDADAAWADMALTTATPSDLQANSALLTAIIICLFTDARASRAEADGSSDLRGWWGDSIDLDPGEAPLGSKLWLLMRSTLTDATAAKAIGYTKAALAPLIASGAVGRFVVDAAANILNQRLDLTVLAYAPNGGQIFGQKFAVIWTQLYPNS